MNKINWDRAHPYNVVTTKMTKKQPEIDEKRAKIEMAGKTQKKKGKVLKKRLGRFDWILKGVLLIFRLSLMSVTPKVPSKGTRHSLMFVRDIFF